MESNCQKYRPSNATEGDAFTAVYCDCCELRRRRDEDYRACPIYLAAVAHQVDDPGYPPEWVIGENGVPRCTAFVPAIGAEDCAPPSARLAMEMMEWLALRIETRPASPDLAEKFRAVEGQL
jgi:hypothetical protein